MKSRLFAIVLGIAVAGPGLGRTCAATLASSFVVSATVQATCKVLASGVTFGTGTGGMVKATSTVSMDCTHSTPYSVGLSAGLGNVAAAAVRTPVDGGPVLLRRSQPSNSQGTLERGRMVDANTVAGTGNGYVQTVAVHGDISAQQDVASGTYADTITVTVIY